MLWFIAVSLRIFALLPGLNLLHIGIGLVASIALVLLGSIVCWRLGRIFGLRYALSRFRTVTKRHKAKPAGIAETVRLLANVTNVIAVIAFPILLSILLLTLPQKFSVPTAVGFVVALAIILIRSLIASHGTDDDAKLQIQFTSLMAVVALFSACLSIVILSWLWSIIVSFPMIAIITALIGALPFGFVLLLDQIKDRVFPAAKRTLAMSMVSLYQRSILLLTLETVILSDIPTVMALAGSGLMSEFYLWCQGFVAFIWAMIFHFTRGTYQYLLGGGIIKRRDVQDSLTEMMQKPLAIC